MSLKRKLEDSLGDLEDKYEAFNKRTGVAEKRFVEKHGDQFDQMRERRELANQRMQKRLDSVGAWFKGIFEKYAEKRERAKIERNHKR